MARDARMSDLIAANPNVEQQMRDWQTERHQRGESPFDWQAFRTLEGFIGATDPGDDPPAEFYWFTPQDTGRTRAPSAPPSSSGAPSATLVSPATLRGGAGSPAGVGTPPSATLVSPATLRASAPTASSNA